jgi:hypothetical protein
VAKINQVNNFPDVMMQTEFENVYNGFQKVGFGTEPGRAENIDAFIVDITGVSGAEFSAAHDLKRVPLGFICVSKTVSGDIWDGGTANTEEAIYLSVGAGGIYKIIVI